MRERDNADQSPRLSSDVPAPPNLSFALQQGVASVRATADVATLPKDEQLENVARSHAFFIQTPPKIGGPQVLTVLRAY
jgi:hypothetical protein